MNATAKLYILQQIDTKLDRREQRLARRAGGRPAAQQLDGGELLADGGHLPDDHGP